MKVKKAADMPAIDFNPQFRKALELMEDTNRNVFITGRAGTGISTLLNYFKDHTENKAVVLARTGVAAINVGGQTVYSFFGFKPDMTMQAIRKKFRDEKKNMYLKAKNEKTRRLVRPLVVGDMEYIGHPFVGLEALCMMRQEKRISAHLLPECLQY